MSMEAIYVIRRRDQKLKKKKIKGGMWSCSDPSSRYSSSRKHGSEMSIPRKWTI